MPGLSRFNRENEGEAKNHAQLRYHIAYSAIDCGDYCYPHQAVIGAVDHWLPGGLYHHCKRKFFYCHHRFIYKSDAERFDGLGDYGMQFIWRHHQLNDPQRRRVGIWQLCVEVCW